MCLFSLCESQIMLICTNISGSSDTNLLGPLKAYIQNDDISYMGVVSIMSGCVLNYPEGNNFHGINALIAIKEDAPVI